VAAPFVIGRLAVEVIVEDRHLRLLLATPLDLALVVLLILMWRSRRLGSQDSE
jgi:hypothetical protein